MNINMSKEDKFNMNEYMEYEMNPKHLELCEDYFCVLGWKIISISRSIEKRIMRLKVENIKNHEK